MRLTFDVEFDIERIDQKAIAVKVLWRAMNKLEELAKRFVAVDEGTLKTAINLFPAYPGALSYVLSDGVDYGVHLEYGTRPHWVPIEPLKEWSKRVLGDEDAAFAVRAAIAKRGTRAQPFFRPALAQVQNYWLQVFWDEEVAKAQQSL